MNCGSKEGKKGPGRPSHLIPSVDLVAKRCSKRCRSLRCRLLFLWVLLCLVPTKNSIRPNLLGSSNLSLFTSKKIAHIYIYEYIYICKYYILYIYIYLYFEIRHVVQYKKKYHKFTLKTPVDFTFQSPTGLAGFFGQFSPKVWLHYRRGNSDFGKMVEAWRCQTPTESRTYCE